MGFYVLLALEDRALRGPILVGILFAVPNLFSRQQLDVLPDWLPKRQVALGLDLRGGSHLLLEIDKSWGK